MLSLVLYRGLYPAGDTLEKGQMLMSQHALNTNFNFGKKKVSLSTVVKRTLYMKVFVSSSHVLLN